MLRAVGWQMEYGLAGLGDFLPAPVKLEDVLLDDGGKLGGEEVGGGFGFLAAGRGPALKLEAIKVGDLVAGTLAYAEKSWIFRGTAGIFDDGDEPLAHLLAHGGYVLFRLRGAGCRSPALLLIKSAGLGSGEAKKAGGFREVTPLHNVQFPNPLRLAEAKRVSLLKPMGETPQCGMRLG